MNATVMLRVSDFPPISDLQVETHNLLVVWSLEARNAALEAASCPKGRMAGGIVLDLVQPPACAYKNKLT
jgi:hypothetical protein